ASLLGLTCQTVFHGRNLFFFIYSTIFSLLPLLQKNETHPFGPRDAQRDHRLARISLSSGVVHSADLVAMMGRGCFPREEMNATKRDLEVLRCKVHLVAQPVGTARRRDGRRAWPRLSSV